jgi:hypothetical protein
MNLTAYLNMEVTPLAQYVPDCERRQKEKARAKSFGPNKNCANANKAKHQQAVARYKSVMGDGWTTTTQIENRLGMSRASCTPNLRKWEEMGLLVRRKVGPTDKWNRRKGYEWRWTSSASETE